MKQGHKFPFPFEPYDVQQTFMDTLYTTLDQGGGSVGILESPTGTGKSLSIIVSSLHWLYDRWPTRMEEEMKAVALDGLDHDEPSWVAAFTVKAKADERVRRVDAKRERLNKKRMLMEEAAANTADNDNDMTVRMNDDEFIVDWDDHVASANATGGSTTRWQDIRDQLDDDDDDDDDDNNNDDEQPQIIYCSRTHSQLSQFVQEIRKTVFKERVHCVSLGSRLNMCINPRVTKLATVSMMNDKCLDMKSKNKSTKSDDGSGSVKKKRAKHETCPYLSSKTQRAYAEDAVVNLHDLEDLVTLGRKSKACPYFGTRRAVTYADIIAIPYASLLHKATRESLGLNLKNRIIIIDEAHNLIETLNQVYSVAIGWKEVNGAASQLQQYFDRYQRRLKPSNKLYIQQLLYFLQSLIAYLGKCASVHATKVMTVNDFVFDASIDNLNLFSLQRFIVESRLVQKLHGFSEVYMRNDCEKKDAADDGGDDDGGYVFKQISWLGRIASFMTAVSNANDDGRVMVIPPPAHQHQQQQQHQHVQLQFLMLNPSVNFSDILGSARAVILAGGTMQPFAHFTEQLFATVPPERMHTLSCGHVVDADNVLALALSRGPSGVEFDFTFQQRSDPQRINELGRLLSNVCGVVPDGVVCFFPSYQYEHEVYTEWQRSGVLDTITKRKQLFREQHSRSSAAATKNVDTILADYDACIHDTKRTGGALLTCVIGGKMSEGINFSDELARCVIVVGLPYANPSDPQLKEKMHYLDQTLEHHPNQPPPGARYYENLCMRAVNQSIGRSIRHRNDYAATLLVDRRYTDDRVCSQLPQWIQQRLQRTTTFGAAFAPLAQFFRGRHTSA